MEYDEEEEEEQEKKKRDRMGEISRQQSNLDRNVGYLS